MDFSLFYFASDEGQQTVDRYRLLLEGARGRLKEGWQGHDLVQLKEAQAEAYRAMATAHSGEAAEAVRQEAATFQQEAEKRVARAEKNLILMDALLNIVAPQETRDYASDEHGHMMPVDEQYATVFRRWDPDLDWNAEEKVVARLREEPEPVRQVIAFWGAVVITLVIASVWLSQLVTSFARLNIQSATAISPFEMLKQGWQSFSK